MHPMLAVLRGSVLLIVAGITGVESTLARAQSLPEQATALQKSLAESQQFLRQYEWIETTAISVDGEEKSRQQKRCYYGADGVLQKIPLTAAPPSEQKRGLRGRIAAKKRENMADYLEQVAELIRSYVPPEPARIEAAKTAGRVSIDLVEPGKRVRLNVRDYAKPDDTLGLEVDLADSRLLGLAVSSYLEDTNDPVKLDARMSLLDTGVTYPKTLTVDAPAKKLRAVVENSGYRKVSP